MDPFPFLKHLSSAPGDDDGRNGVGVEGLQGLGLVWLTLGNGEKIRGDFFAPKKTVGRWNFKEISGDGLTSLHFLPESCFFFGGKMGGCILQDIFTFPFHFSGDFRSCTITGLC